MEYKHFTLLYLFSQHIGTKRQYQLISKAREMLAQNIVFFLTFTSKVTSDYLDILRDGCELIFFLQFS